MPKPLHYKSDALIYCEGDESDKVYILRSGHVSLVTEDVTREFRRETVVPGEFFGVRSAVGHYTRDENAVVTSEATVEAFTVPEFELYIMSDSKIILNLLKVFSSQIRQIHSVIGLLSCPGNQEADEGLFGIGEKYLKKGRYSQAKYVFTRYLAVYPKGRDAEKAARNLRLAEIGLNGGSAEAPEKFDARKAYYTAVNLIKAEKYNAAMRIFGQIADSDDINWAAKGDFEVGRCLFLLNKFEECIKHYKKMFLLEPNHPDAKDAMFYAGQACEKTGQKDLAVEWYNKVIAMPTSVNDKTRPRTIQALEALGG